jgi:hypothetical protein
LLVDQWHLTLPLIPLGWVSLQFSREMGDADMTDFSCIEFEKLILMKMIVA